MRPYPNTPQWLPASRAAWQTPEFDKELLEEITRLGATCLPLQSGLTSGNVALFDNLEIMVLSKQASTHHLTLRLGVFFQSLIAGCSCADDPTPVDPIEEYCELRGIMDLRNGETRFTLWENPVE